MKANIKIKFVPYEKFRKNNIKNFLKDLESNTIILIDAKLTPEEEAGLIKQTMEKVSSSFSGIELSSLDGLESKEGSSGLDRVKTMIAEMLTGKKRGLTILGPAKMVRKIERNPEELLLHM